MAHKAKQTALSRFSSTACYSLASSHHLRPSCPDAWNRSALVAYTLDMARTKSATRRRPTANRSQLKPVSKESFVASAETPPTPTTIATLNGTDLPTLVASEDGSLSPSPTVSSSASLNSVSQPKARRKSEAERTPYLARNLVGNKTRRIGIREPGKATKTIMSFCVDCVRPHLWIYCDGTRALKTHLCEFHEKE